MRLVGEAIKELPHLPAETKTCDGVYWNDQQFRFESWWSGTILCWMSLEQVGHFGKNTEQKLKEIISGSDWPFSYLLLNIFFPGWQIPFYLSNGYRIDALGQKSHP